MPDDSQPQPPLKRSPHVLDLSGSFATDIAGSVNALRGTVTQVIGSSGVVLRPEESPAETLIASAGAKQAAPVEEAAPFQPYVRTYHTISREVRTAKEEQQLQRVEDANERRFRTNPAALLRTYAGRPDPGLTSARLAAEIEQRAQQPASGV